MSNDNTHQIRFHFFSLKFIAYKELDLASNNILRNIVNFINDEKKKGNGVVIDRHKNRDNEASRELYINRATFLPKEQRIRCTIALLRSGKTPLIKPHNELELVPLDTTQGTIAEETHFFIDYSRIPAVVCVEYNYHGPRIADIEYYLRQLGRDKLAQAKQTDVNIYMDASIDDTLNDLREVLNIDLKVNPQNISQFDNDIKGKYYTGMSTLGNKLRPRYLKLELMFQAPGQFINSTEINKSAKQMVMEHLRKFKAKPYHIEGFENFQVKYEDKDGNEQLFNLLSGKKELLKDVDLDKIKSSNDWYKLIADDFTKVIQEL